ncbi:helix-turn-helix transcriptional regulator [Streptomyces sp. NBC_00269]|uniref:helix-turn-helix transcriptional regulator n=1 Tax=Streptomyces sp. NBC_00269 TaxID=2975696 RepID=UPI002E2E80E0|nr:helix-turn-helix domain-containing protein [Streptomyces sp. NBC_00269]
MSRQKTLTRKPIDELPPLNMVLDEIGISRAAWYRWRNRGLSPVTHRLPNGHLRVRRSDLDAFLDGMEVS